MSGLDLPALLPTVKDIALEAGEVILGFYRDGFSVEGKADGSPVTAADRAADDLIVARLKALAPDIPVVSEESYAAGVRPDVTGGRFWLVDPLDGTKEFVNRNGEFTVNIGLIDRGVPVLGVILVPVTGVLYWGVMGQGAGQGAGCRDSAGERPIQARPAPADGLTVAASRSHRNPALEAYLKTVPMKDQKVAGSSLKFCLVAEGAADLYPRTGPTSEWDTAAGHAIVLAAGGRVDLMDGTPLPYGKPNFLNPEFVVRGR
ncbi:3'(2'),5'-bisphosphate nucleotidase CysQ [Oceanibaculum pacificum]|uniref:3'(2'),5'-bisphosphate nucleotidase CysQ n=1 Tax=Oceanibaculum pacificum TaxID=580166 RepID=A0A154WFQ4_9PROT|nr:3'(2'),5'-bisphosphate nucleotidase CysQ [Oceanibaculum pacificum]KZD12350.1 3'(2'),5'-bisphosphate nucleotidase CysQ [Oceanibaculum pacificum]